MATKEQIQTRIQLTDVQYESRQKDVQETLRFLRNDFRDVTEADETQVNTLAPNFMMATKRQVLAQLYPGDPKFYCRPRKRGFEDRGRAVSALLEYYWKEIDAETVMRGAIDDGLTYGFGCVKVGFGRLQSHVDMTEEEPEAIERVQRDLFDFMERNPVPIEENQRHEVDIEFKTQFIQQPELAQHPEAELIIPDILSNIEEHQKMIDEKKDYPVNAQGDPSPDWPFMERVTPDIFWDPMVDDPKKSAYVIHRIQRRLLDVKSDPLYKNTKDLEPDAYNEYSEALKENDESEIPEELALVTIYEIWDARDRTVGTYARGQDKPLRAATKEAWPEFIAGFPFHWFAITEISGEYPAPGVMEYLKFAQRALMRLYSELMTHSDRSATKYTGNKDAIADDETKEEIESKLAGATDGIVLWSQSGQPVITPVQSAQVDPSKIAVIGMIKGTISENAGVSLSEIADTSTATAASIATSGINTLVADALSKVEKMQSSCAKDVVGMVRQFGPKEQLFRVVGPYGDGWEEYTINDVQAGWQIDVEMPTPEQGEREKQNWMSLFNLLVSEMDPVGKREFILDGLRIFGVKNVSRFIEDPPIEVVAHVELEHAMMSMGNPVDPREGEDHDEHLKLHMPRLQELGQQQQMAQQQEQAQAQTGEPQPQQQQPPENPEVQLLQTHIQQTEELRTAQGQPQGRRTKVASPTGNPGRTESILSNQSQGT